MRTFESKPARRERVPLLVGLMGPSGGGKTYSALRLASGIQQVTGGDIHVIDTEARRALHYADRFTFQHVQFDPPFGPADYLSAIEYCYAKGGRTIVVDSMSHEHEGTGGVLEMHEAEVERLTPIFRGNREATNFPAWAKPKAERQKLINRILQLQCNFIFCFRAKDKSKPGKDKDGKKALLELGYMPIAGQEFVYEMTLCCLLMPGAKGVPTWQPTELGERQMVKLPEQFRKLLLGQSGPLDENVGAQLAQWAAGDAPAAPAPQASQASQQVKTLAAMIAEVTTLEGLEPVKAELALSKADLSKRDAHELGKLYSAKAAEFVTQAAPPPEGRQMGEDQT